MMVDDGAGRVRKVDMDYPSNSKHNRPRRKKEPQAPVVTGKVVRKKKSVGSKLVETFTGDDVESVADYVFMDVMVPAAKTMLSDMVSEGIERLLFGTTKRSGHRRPSGRSSYTSYSKYNSGHGDSWGSRREPPARSTRQARPRHDFTDIIFMNRKDADAVVDRLLDVIDEYGVVTIADLNDIAGVDESDYTDNRWGWMNLSTAEVRRIREGYILDLPEPKVID